MGVSYTPQYIADTIGGILYGNPSEVSEIRFLLTDSRKLVFAPSSLFFALKTSKNNGHNYIGPLVEKGVQCFVVSELPQNKEWLQRACFVLVNDTLEALQKLVSVHRNHFSYPVVGITGSNGKTIIKEWLSQLLSEKFFLVKNPRSYNSQTGVPLSVWEMDASHEIGVFEAGISRLGEMERLEPVIRPRWGIFSNIGPAHNEGFPDITAKIHEKLKLFARAELLIYHCDNDSLDNTILKWASAHNHVQLFRWGSKCDADMTVVSRDTTPTGTYVKLKVGEQFFEHRVPFSDEASLENVLHCLAFLHSRGFANGWINERLLQLRPVAMRLEMRQAINDCILVNDAYNSDILSLGIALDFLNTQVKQKEKVLILSDILQAGMDHEKLYRQVAGLVKAKGIKKLIAIGEALSLNKHFFKGLKADFFPDTKSFLKDWDFNQFREQGILVKGARDFGFESISNRLQHKDHQTVLEINLDALVHNLNVYKSLLKPGVKLAAMVKAFSYGSGSYEIAGLLQYHQVDYLAVAFADEGKELRNAGISIPIMVLNPELHNMDVLFRYKLEPEVYSLELLKKLEKEASLHMDNNTSEPYQVHIKLDTGMHRLGFLENELDVLLLELKKCSHLKVSSVFSHFAASDLDAFDDFSKEQMEKFHTMCHKLEQGLGYSFLKHISNSAAISRLPEAQMGMVRLGIGMYGVDANPAIAGTLQPVATFKSVISQIKEVPAGHTVGYNRAAKLQRDTRLAIVPVGYADGLNRRLGNGKGSLFVNGHKAPLVGNISMDMCAIDVTGIPASPGDEVIIFGVNPSVVDMARLLETIPYEVLTSISARVKRIYFQE